jgi:hypothetical protein
MLLAELIEYLPCGAGAALGYLAKALLQIAGELRFIQRLLWPGSQGTSGDDGLDVAVERKAESLRFSCKLGFDLGLEFEVDHG